MKCLEKAIGITRSECVCITANLPNGYDESTSGFYIDEIPEFPINLLAFKVTNECLTMANILKGAREGAVRDLQKDLYKLLGAKYKQRDAPFSGTIGSKVFNTSLNTNTDYAGLEITAQPYRGAVALLKRIYTSFNFTGSITLKIFKGHVGDDFIQQVGDAITLNSVSGSLTDNPITTPIELPLYDNSGATVKYLLRYETANGAITPRNNESSCGCGDLERDAKKYITWQGFATNFGSSAIGLSYYPGFMMGLNPELEIKCGNETMFCEQYKIDERLSLVLNNLLVMKAGSNAIKTLLTNGIINRYTMADRESMALRATQMKREYSNDLQWITENINLNGYDCNLCSESSNTYTVGKIRL